MKVSHPQISIKTMTDYHLESFISCPYKFYYQHVLQLSSGMRWRQVVQYTCNRVVQKFYKLPLEARNHLNTLKLIEKAWRPIRLRFFDSRVQYYKVIAKTTDHLLRFLVKERSGVPPLFLYQKLNAYIEELDTRLQVTFELAQWSTDHTFTINKFLIEADEEMLQLYYHLLVVFSDKVFKKLPEKISMMTLLDGKEHIFTPRLEDVSTSIQYLQTIKYLLQQHPTEYYQCSPLKECKYCPFAERCQGEQVRMGESIRTNEKFLH